MALSQAAKEARADKMRAQWARERAERAVERLSADPKATGDQKKAAKSLLSERKTAEKKAIAAFEQAKSGPVEVIEVAEIDRLLGVEPEPVADEWPQGGPGNTEPPDEVQVSA